jgi:alkylation response protein AidB-like acyl-CoA dehydrogenase
MAKLLADQRDQKFVFHEMLEIEELFGTSRYGHLSKGMVDASLYESFMHNCGFMWIWSTPFSATYLIEKFGTDDQKARYLPRLASGKWGSALAIHEDACGSDVGMQTCVAVRQPDGSFRIKGVKNPVTCGDSDLLENLIHVVCARIEGDPENETGISMFLVPKFAVQADGSLGARNDVAPLGVEEKLGVRGNPTCEMAYGQTGGCWAELLGEERPGHGHDLPGAEYRRGGTLSKMCFPGWTASPPPSGARTCPLWP